MSAERTVSFLVTLCFYKRNAPYVWSLVLPFATTAYSITKSRSIMEILGYLKKLGNPIRHIGFRSVLKSNMTLLTAALKIMTNLKSLELRLKASDKGDENASILLGQTTFQLGRFLTTLECNTALGRFLQTQKQLTELHCPLTAVILDKNLLPPGSLPKLSTFTWSSSMPMTVVRYITNGRPIDKVTVMVETQVPDLAPLLDIGRHSANVKQVSLVINSEYISAAHVHEIAEQFPEVSELCLKTRRLAEDFLKQLTASIHEFKCLKRLIVGAIVVPSFKHYWEDPVQRQVKACFEKCSTLAHLVFPVVEKERIRFYVFRRQWVNGKARGIEYLIVEKSTVVQGGLRLNM